MKPMVTEFSTFYKAVNGNEVRYYPGNGLDNREFAQAFDKVGDPPKVQGFAVYDTAVSTVYAVALYTDKASAEKHKVSAPESAPESAIDDDPAPTALETPSEALTDAQTPDTSPSETEPAPAKSKKRGKSSKFSRRS